MLALQGDTYPPPLHLLGRHDDDVRVLLVDHLPEVHHRDLQAALRGDEHFALLPGTALLPEALEADSGSERGGLPGAVRAKPRCVWYGADRIIGPLPQTNPQKIRQTSKSTVSNDPCYKSM